MKFFEFLNKLYDNSHKPGKDLYLVQLFSALCGDCEPFKNVVPDKYSGKESKCSSAVPPGLTGSDPTYRRRFYKKASKGLTKPLKNHINEHKNCDTFVGYLKIIVLPESFSELCKSFGVSKTVDTSVMYKAVFEQFLVFALSPHHDVDNIIPDKVQELSAKKIIEQNDIVKNQNESDVSLSQDPNFHGTQSEKPNTKVRATTGLVVDQKYIKCMSCKQWFGRINDAMQVPSGVYGRCSKYDKELISTSGENCKDYEPNYAVVAEMITSDKLSSRRTGLKLL